MLKQLAAVYYHYVDDIITSIPKSGFNEMLDTFNSYNSRLQFTHEIETKNSISFLDILLIKENQKIITNWYAKRTFSGRFLNYHSQHPLSQKIAMVYNVTDRAIKLADIIFHKDNINTAKNLLKENNYPTKFINKYISKRDPRNFP